MTFPRKQDSSELEAGRHHADRLRTSSGLQSLDSLCKVQERSVIAGGSRDCDESMRLFVVNAPMASALLKRPSITEQSSHELLDLLARAVSLHETAPMLAWLYREAKDPTAKRQSVKACLAPTTSTASLYL